MIDRAAVGDRVVLTRAVSQGRRGTVVAVGVDPRAGLVRVQMDGDSDGNWVSLHTSEYEKISLLDLLAEVAAERKQL